MKIDKILYEFKLEKTMEVEEIETSKNEKGEDVSIICGCYGIGVSRTMGVLVEIFSDDKGIIWPESVAPFKVHLVALTEETVDAEALYNELTSKGVEVLFDDRAGLTPGEKFADADLLGMPWRVVISKRSLEAGGVEVKKRNEKDGRIVALADVSALFV